MQNNDTPPSAFRLIDSPWLWGLMFSLMALVGLGLIRPKFDVRQRQIDPSAVKSKRIVPLWTLASAATVSACGCGYMLYREWRKKENTR